MHRWCRPRQKWANWVFGAGDGGRVNGEQLTHRLYGSIVIPLSKKGEIYHYLHLYISMHFCCIPQIDSKQQRCATTTTTPQDFGQLFLEILCVIWNNDGAPPPQQDPEKTAVDFLLQFCVDTVSVTICLVRIGVFGCSKISLQDATTGVVWKIRTWWRIWPCDLPESAGEIVNNKAIKAACQEMGSQNDNNCNSIVQKLPIAHILHLQYTGFKDCLLVKIGYFFMK